MQIKNINILTLLFLYNSILSLKSDRKTKYESLENEFSNNTRLKTINECKILKKIEHSITEMDKVIENILIYSTKGESIETVLKRIGSKKYRNSLSTLKNSIKLILYKEKIATITDNTNELKIEPQLLGKLFSNFIYDGDFSYCKNIISVGYIILRIIGHFILDYDELRIFLKNLFFHLISKGFGINSYNKTKQYVALKLTKNLYIYLANFILNTDVRLIEDYWEFKMQKFENINELVDDLYHLFCFHLNFLDLSNKSSTSNNFLAAKTKMEKWFMLNRNNFFNKDLFFQLYTFNLVRNINRGLKNTDLIYIQNILNDSLNNGLNELNKFTRNNFNFLNIFHKSSYDKNIFNQDWILNLSEYIKCIENDQIKFFLKPYKKFEKIHVISTIKEESGLELETENVNYVVEKKPKIADRQKLYNEKKQNNFENKFKKISDVFAEKKKIYDEKNIKFDDINESIKIPEEDIKLKKVLKDIKKGGFSKSKSESEETQKKLIKL